MASEEIVWYNAAEEVDIIMALSEAHKAATSRYNKKAYERLAFDVRRDADLNGDAIRMHAKSRGESLNAFLKRAVAETIERDNRKDIDLHATE